MCGIVVAVGYPRGRGEAVIRAVLGAMQYRGLPGRSNIVWDPQSRMGVGHVRLPISGLDESHDQPLVTDDTTIAFVGEIVNYKDLNPEASCDLDEVYDTVQGNNDRTPQDWDGFWSMAVLRHAEPSARIAMDFLAKKPLYVREDQDGIVVASEIAPLLQAGPVELDEIYLSAVRKWGYSPEPSRTWATTIRRLPPGVLIEMRPNPSGSGAFYSATLIDGLRPRDEVHLSASIREAVRRRVVSSDREVGVLASGGLDSSIVASVAARVHQDRPITLYHVDNDEREYLDDLARYIRSSGLPDPRLVEVRLDDVTDQDVLDVMQEPVDLGSVAAQIALARGIRKASPDAHVVLTGDGADELFGGYGRASRYDSQRSDIFHELVNYHLPRLDRCMMRETIEARSPFLARDVVEGALSLPYSYRTSKQFLKEAFANILPPSIVSREKKALKIPSMRDDQDAMERRFRLVDMFVERFQDERGRRDAH